MIKFKSHIHDELLEMGFKACASYIKQLKSGTVEHRSMKICFLGEGRIGKTCLLQFLSTGEKQKQTASTQGINIEDINKLFPDIHATAWDFGGQREYLQLEYRRKLFE